MSTMALVQGQGKVVAAWETAGQIYFAEAGLGTTTFSNPQPAPGKGKERKHPALAVNDRGDTILVWTEGTGWERGGALAWQVYDKNGTPTEAGGRIEGGIPVWGLPAVVAVGERFTIFH